MHLIFYFVDWSSLDLRWSMMNEFEITELFDFVLV